MMPSETSRTRTMPAAQARQALKTQKTKTDNRKRQTTNAKSKKERQVVLDRERKMQGERESNKRKEMKMPPHLNAAWKQQCCIPLGHFVSRRHHQQQSYCGQKHTRTHTHISHTLVHTLTCKYTCLQGVKSKSHAGIWHLAQQHFKIPTTKVLRNSREKREVRGVSREKGTLK